MIGDFESARRYFAKATALNHRFAPAWVGFGHAFAAQDESDQVRCVMYTYIYLFICIFTHIYTYMYAHIHTYIYNVYIYN